MRAIAGIAVILFSVLLGCVQVALAAPTVGSYLNPLWQDADKLNDQGNWAINYWDDSDDDGHWDKTEPMADQILSVWSKPRQATDLSCWIASAANMLASAGLGGGNAQNIYWDMIYNMTTSWHPGGWQYGGWQHEAVNWYLSNRPHEGIYSVAYYGVYNKRDGTSAQAWPADPFDLAADLLASSQDVGIVIHGSGIYHAVTFQGYDDQGHITITDSDRDAGMNDLNSYGFDKHGATRWFITDYVSGGIAVDYFATLRRVPEPDPLLLLLAGLIALRAAKSRRPARSAH